MWLPNAPRLFEMYVFAGPMQGQTRDQQQEMQLFYPSPSSEDTKASSKLCPAAIYSCCCKPPMCGHYKDALDKPRLELQGCKSL